MALQGTLDTFALPDVLRLLATTRKSGQLHIAGDRGSGRISMTVGAVAAVDAPGAALASEPADALLDLLRCKAGTFTFDPEAAPDGPAVVDVETLLGTAEALLAEWHELEQIVPSPDAWVTLRATLPEPEVTIDQHRWSTLVAVGAGRTVRRLGEELGLAEMPVLRAVRDLVEAGVVEVTDSAPAAVAAPSDDAVVDDAEDAPASATTATPVPDVDPDRPPGPRAHRARPRSRPVEPAEPAPFANDHDDHDDLDELASAFPGLAARASTPVEPSTDPAPEAAADDDDDEELARQLATLSPRAAQAVRAAAEAATDEEREAALAAVSTGEDDEPLDRGLLLRFLSSVKS